MLGYRTRSQSLASRRLKFERLEERELLAADTYLINFQLEAALTPTRYAADTGEVFGLRNNGWSYGWSTDHTDVARERNAHADQRLDTLIHFHQNQSWELQLPNGQYQVTVSIGDPSFGSTHTLNVEGVNVWNAVALGSGAFLTDTRTVTVNDGRLTLNQGSAAEMATRINFIHVVGLPSGPNNGPAAPTIMEPVVEGDIVNPADVHMEAVDYVDPEGDEHYSTDWEIWTTGPSPERVWHTLGITGVERLHTHLGDGIFENSHAGRTDLISTPIPNFNFNTYSITIPGVTAGDQLTISTDMLNAIGGGGANRSAMVDSFVLTTNASGNLLSDGSFELATNNTQTSNSAWVMTAQSDGVEPAGAFQTATWAAASGNTGVWFKGYRGTPGVPVDASVTQVVTAPTSGDYTLTFAAKIEQNFPTTVGAFRTSIASSGSGGMKTIDLLNSFAPEYQLRVRFRDAVGAVSAYATRNFIVDEASTTFPLELEGIAASPTPTWTTANDNPIILPVASPNQSQLRLEGPLSDLLLSFTGNNGVSNTIMNPGTLDEHVNPRAVIVAGSNGLNLGPTEIRFADDAGQQRAVYLPAINLGANGRLDLWIAADGSTYYGIESQTEPVFTSLARQAELPVPFIAFEPGYQIDEVAGGLQLPVNIAFVPNPGSDPDDPLFYVNELYGTIKVVSNDFTVSTYATNLLNFNPTGAFPGSGEQGLAGLVVDPLTGDVFVTRVTDTDGIEGGVHHPQVVRLSSTDGGRTASTITVIRDMVGESQGQSHQISNLTIGPDGKLYVHNGDGFTASTALNLDSYRGKVLRMNLDGTAPSDNPFYNASNGINARDYVYAYGFRNPFGGAWRAADGKHYTVENGNALDRLARVDSGGNYGWNGSDSSLLPQARYVWNPAHAPVNITFVEPETFGGSQFPGSKQGHAFVSESGPTYALGQQTAGKRIIEFVFDANGNVVGAPTTLVEYVGIGRGTVSGLIAGPDGLYFTELYKDLDPVSPIDFGARIFRVRFTAGGDADFDLDGDVDGRDFLAWQRGAGSANPTKASGDANNDDVVNSADLAIWQAEYGNANLSAVSSLVSAYSASTAPLSTHAESEAEADVAVEAGSLFGSLPVFWVEFSATMKSVAFDYSVSDEFVPLEQIVDEVFEKGPVTASYGVESDPLAYNDGQKESELIDDLFASWGKLVDMI